MPASGWIEREAPAKVNLGLKVTGRRADGFHDIESIFVPLELCDRIRLRPAAADAFRCSDPALPVGSANLAWRAVEAWRRAAAVRPELAGQALQPVELELEKTIPAGAGLGGGSSDAAAVLLALDELFAPGLGIETLHRICLTLGSDVPFFLHADWMHVAGRGEVLTPLLPLFSGTVLLVWPGLSIETGPAYAQLSLYLTNHSGYANFVGFRGFAESGSRPPGWPENDFEAVVFGQHPFLAGLKQEILDGGARYAALSGSGSSIFGFFDSDRSVIDLMRSLRQRHPATFLTRPRTARNGSEKRGESEDHRNQRQSEG